MHCRLDIIVTGGLLAAFFLLLMLRLDGVIEWSWFLIFAPMWILNGQLLGMTGTRIVKHYQHGFDINHISQCRKFWYLLCACLKMAFEVLLCIRLSFDVDLSLYVVIIPAWIVLFGLIVEVLLGILFFFPPNFGGLRIGRRPQLTDMLRR